VNPGARLHVNSDNVQLFLAADNNAFPYGLFIRKNKATETIYEYNGPNYAHIIQFDNAPLIFGTNNLERVRIDSAGNVGIGTISPTSLLHLEKSDNDNALLYVRNTGGGGTSPTAVFRGGANNAANHFQIQDYSGNVDFVVQGTGNVGIGTISPSGALDVRNSSNCGVFMADANGNVIEGIDGGNLGTLWLNYTSTGGVFLAHGGGSVAIGATTIPDGAKLVVQGGGVYINAFNSSGNEVHDWPFAAFSIRRIDNYGIMRMIQFGHSADSPYQTGDGVWHISLHDFDGGSKTTSNANTHLFISGPGNFGIGSPSASYRLYVAGSAYSTGGWSGSDLRWKTNIQALPDPLSKLLKLRAVEYDWKVKEFPQNHFSKARQIGIIAQEMEQEFPELVNTDKEGYKAIAYDKLAAVLLEAIKSQQREIEELRREVVEIKKLGIRNT